MKRGMIYMICLFCAMQVMAQSGFDLILNNEGKIIAFPKIREYNIVVPDFDFYTFTPSSSIKLDTKLLEFKSDYQITSFNERPMDMQVLSGAYRPFFNPFTPMLRKVNPMALDFNETAITPLSENWFFLINGRKYSWPGAGGLTTINPAMVWNKDKWTITGSGFASHFSTPFNLSPDYTIGANLHVRYDVHERVALRAWGQYAHYFENESNNPHLMMNPFFYHTGVGGAMEFKINENFGVGMGVNYEYNQRRRRMEPQYLIYPVFNTGKFQIRVQ